MVGEAVSRKVIVCTQLLLFPQRSIAVQVRRMEALPVQFVAPTESAKLMAAALPHVSTAVARPVLLVVGNTVHSKVMFAGQRKTGATVSLKSII